MELKPEGVVKRHYYVYGGKKQIEQLPAAVTDIRFISDDASWKRGGRLLVFDGATRENRPSLENLESMCVRKCAIRREGIYRTGIRLRRDFQLVIRSEISPYELYAFWDRTWERDLMGPEHYRVFDTYFTVIGDDDGARAEFLTPSLLLDSYEEARASIVHQVKRSVRRLPAKTVTAMRTHLTGAVKLTLFFRFVFIDVYEMFRYLDACLPTSDLSWYEVGSGHWYHTGEVRASGLAG